MPHFCLHGCTRPFNTAFCPCPHLTQRLFQSCCWSYGCWHSRDYLDCKTPGHYVSPAESPGKEASSLPSHNQYIAGLCVQDAQTHDHVLHCSVLPGLHNISSLSSGNSPVSQGLSHPNSSYFPYCSSLKQLPCSVESTEVRGVGWGPSASILLLFTQCCSYRSALKVPAASGFIGPVWEESFMGGIIHQRPNS